MDSNTTMMLEAYRKGQRDMRDRIERQWRGWHTSGIGGMHRAMRGDRKGYGNVSVMIRRANKILTKTPLNSHD